MRARDLRGVPRRATTQPARGTCLDSKYQVKPVRVRVRAAGAGGRDAARKEAEPALSLRGSAAARQAAAAAGRGDAAGLELLPS